MCERPSSQTRWSVTLENLSKAPLNISTKLTASTQGVFEQEFPKKSATAPDCDAGSAYSSDKAHARRTAFPSITPHSGQFVAKFPQNFGDFAFQTPQIGPPLLSNFRSLTTLPNSQVLTQRPFSFFRKFPNFALKWAFTLAIFGFSPATRRLHHQPHRFWENSWFSKSKWVR
jgi:hypothetical protein